MSLRLETLTRRFGRQLALDGVSIRVRRGDCYGFLGHNGAGKTTAMRIALGLDRADAGRVWVDGFDARERPREARARMGGLIEVPGFHAALDGTRNLMLLARLQGLSRSEARREAGELLELVGLEQAGRKSARAYSQGMRQRLGIAQALLGRPPYVLLDEPTNGLDPEGIAEIRTLLQRLTRDEGMTVLLSSHQLHEISDLCNRIGVLNHGRLVVEEETARLFASAPGRYRLVTDRNDEAARVLAGLSIQAEASNDGGLVLALGEQRPGEVARRLVEAGLALEHFGPRPVSLEEVYLRFAHEERVQAGQPAQEPESAPEDSTAAFVARAPSAPVRRMVRHEFGRWSARGGAYALLVLPALLGVLAIALDWKAAQRGQAGVELGELFGTTDVTAFQGFGNSLNAGLMLLGVLLAGFASQSIAGEFSRGTLRNVMLRPVGRWPAALGKALAALGLGLVAYGMLALSSFVLAGAVFEYGDLVEILPNGATFPMQSAEDMWPELQRALLAPLAPLAAFVGIGFLAGALTRTAAGALGLALGAVVFLDLLRGVGRGYDFEHWLPTAYLPSPLGDTSYLRFYSQFVEGINNATFEYASTALTVPLAWTLITIALAAWLLSRRSIP